MPLLWLSIAVLLGVWLAPRLDWPALTWGLVVGVSFALFIIQLVLTDRLASLPRLRLRLPNPDGFPPSQLSVFLLLSALALGGLCYQAAQPRGGPGSIAAFNDLEGELSLHGVVVRPPELREAYDQLTVQVDKIRPAGGVDQPAFGLLLARLPPGGDWRYGDRLALHGQPLTPPGDEDFSYRDYLARQGIHSYLPYARAELAARGQGNRLLTALYALRARGLVMLYRLFPDPEASLLAGILLGVESGIPADVLAAFQDSGTAHIIAISGFNIAIVAGLFIVLFGRLLGKRKGALAALAAIALYTLLVGAGASVVRAAIMAGLALLAAQLGRRANGLNTLAIVAALMVSFSPGLLWDVGFQLSFMATLGLVLYAGLLLGAVTRLAERFAPGEAARRVARPAGEYFLFTLAVLLTVLPVSAYYFEKIPLAAPFANLFILPAQPGVMILGGLAMLLGMLFQPVGQLAAYLAWPFVAYTIRMAEFWAQFERLILNLGQVSGLAVLGFYVLLFGLTFGLPAWRARRRAAQGATPERAGAGGLAGAKTWLWRAAAPLAGLMLAGLALAAVLVWRAAAAAPDGRLRLTVMDVGSGDGLLIRTPSGRAVLIDGGESTATLADALGRRLPLGMRQLDFLIVAGGEDEQIGALPGVLERYPAGQVLWAGPSGGTRSASRLREVLVDGQIPLSEAQTGQELDLGGGARLMVVSANRRGAVLLLERKNFRALLPLGLDRAALETLQADPALGPVTALLLADSGYAPLNPLELIQKLHPQLVLLSVEAGDRRGLPDEETLEAMEGYTLLRTDQNGWIEISTDGELLWVEAAR